MPIPVPVLHSVGLRSTTQRQAILAYLESVTRPVSARTVHDAVKRRGIDRSSVFRTLHALSQIGLIAVTEDAAHVSLYELQRTHHHHVQCISCETMKPVECFIPKKRLDAIRRKAGFSTIQHGGDLYGICHACAKRAA